MKERRLITSFLISLLTLGVYGIYWNASMAKEFASELGERRNIYLDMILLAFTFGIYNIYLMWKNASYINRIADKRLEYTDNLTEFSIITVLIGLSGWFPYILQDKMNTFVLSNY